MPDTPPFTAVAGVFPTVNPPPPCRAKKGRPGCRTAPFMAPQGGGMRREGIGVSDYSSFQVNGTTNAVAPPGGGGTEPARVGVDRASLSSVLEPDGATSSVRSIAPLAAT